jgi:hypothetical protein
MAGPAAGTSERDTLLGMPAKDRTAYRRHWEAANRKKIRGYARAKRAKADYKRREKERYKIRWLQRTAKIYNVTPEKLDDLILRSEGRCEICSCALIGAPRTPNDLCVDHDHEEGHARGILCRLCNMALGGLKDDLDIVIAAATYLRRVAGPGG